MSSLAGKVVGNFSVIRKLGSGGMGDVYLAENRRFGRRVAIKTLLPRLAADQRAVQRFFNEARAANAANSEHIVEILDCGELPEGTAYFVMELLEGRTLTQAIFGQPPFAVERAAHVFLGIAAALEAVHLRGIVHRDLKPDNVYLVSKFGDPDFVKVLDFGIAKLLNKRGSESAPSVTRSGDLVGTPRYMAPEQCRGAVGEIDQRTDIYSAGVLLFEMLTGRPPFLAEHSGDLLVAHMTMPPPDVRALRPEVPVELADAVARALAKSRDERFQRIEEMMNVVGAFASPARARRSIESLAPLGSFDDPRDEPEPAARPISGQPITTLGGVATESTVGSMVATRRLFSWVAAAVVVIAIVGGAVLRPRAISSDAPPRAEPAPAARPAPNAIAAPSPPGPLAAPSPAPPRHDPSPPPAAPARAGTIRITVRASPAQATLLLDGKPTSNPLARTFAADGASHLLTATAPDGSTASRRLTFDRDRDIHLQLAPPQVDTPARAPRKPGIITDYEETRK